MATEAKVENTEVKVEDVKVDQPAGEDMPELENPGDAQEAKGGNKQSKNEKKSRKAVQKLGLKPVTGITRVTLKKGKQYLFVISEPEVYKSPAADTYIIFGEAKIEDVTSTLRDAAAKFQGADGNIDPNLLANLTGSETAEPTKVEETAAPTSEDEKKYEKEIQLVLEQAPNATRQQALAALKKSDGEIVSAIMELTMGS